ncbi:DUF6059 family protein [Streptomyces sp. NPDC060048]|uniref:DUF6059 family protein n=1 Tax=unclassified Streptomyces TaxID=2593676 RepID=UPI00369711CC
MRNRKWWAFIAGLGAVGGVWVPLAPLHPDGLWPGEKGAGLLPERPVGGPPPGHPEKWDSLRELSPEEIEIWRQLI